MAWLGRLERATNGGSQEGKCQSVFFFFCTIFPLDYTSSILFQFLFSARRWWRNSIFISQLQNHTLLAIEKKNRPLQKLRSVHGLAGAISLDNSRHRISKLFFFLNHLTFNVERRKSLLYRLRFRNGDVPIHNFRSLKLTRCWGRRDSVISAE